ncbi:hypothetical protein CsSME_00020418 [Camellia sinensis var. sinensis]
MEKTSKTLLPSSTKSQALLLVVGLLLIVPLFARPLDLSRTHMASSSSSSSSVIRVLLESPTTTHDSTTKSRALQSKISFSTTTASTTTTKSRQFGVAAHEVPSGPNPESNR